MWRIKWIMARLFGTRYDGWDDENGGSAYVTIYHWRGVSYIWEQKHGRY